MRPFGGRVLAVAVAVLLSTAACTDDAGDSPTSPPLAADRVVGATAAAAEGASAAADHPFDAAHTR
jgi:hypothetical protein